MSVKGPGGGGGRGGPTLGKHEGQSHSRGVGESQEVFAAAQHCQLLEPLTGAPYGKVIGGVVGLWKPFKVKLLATRLGLP